MGVVVADEGTKSFDFPHDGQVVQRLGRLGHGDGLQESHFATRVSNLLELHLLGELDPTFELQGLSCLF